MASQDRQAERGEGGAGRRDSARCVDRCSAARHALYFCFPYLQMLSFRDQTSWVAETGTSWSGGWVPGIHSKPHTSWSSSTAAPRPTILHAFMLRRSGTFVAWMLAPVGNPPGRGRCMLASLRQTKRRLPAAQGPERSASYAPVSVAPWPHLFQSGALVKFGALYKVYYQGAAWELLMSAALIVCDGREEPTGAITMRSPDRAERHSKKTARALPLPEERLAANIC